MTSVFGELAGEAWKCSFLGFLGCYWIWTILCPPDKNDLLVEYINKIKAEAGKILWLPFGRLNTTWSFIEVKMKEWPRVTRSMKTWWLNWSFHGGVLWTSRSTWPEDLILMLWLVFDPAVSFRVKLYVTWVIFGLLSLEFFDVHTIHI